MTTCETLIDRNIGRFGVSVKTVYDESPDYSYLGKFSNMNWHPESYIYHRRSGLMYDGTFWRNQKGQIQAEPDLHDYYSREYQFIDIGTCQFNRNDKHSLRYAFENALRLDRMGDDWSYLGVIAEIQFEGATIGRDSLWGIESDSDRSYFAEVSRDCISQALSEARQFIRRLCKA